MKMAPEDRLDSDGGAVLNLECPPPPSLTASPPSPSPPHTWMPRSPPPPPPSHHYPHIHFITSPPHQHPPSSALLRVPSILLPLCGHLCASGEVLALLAAVAFHCSVPSLERRRTSALSPAQVPLRGGNAPFLIFLAVSEEFIPGMFSFSAAFPVPKPSAAFSLRFKYLCALNSTFVFKAVSGHIEDPCTQVHHLAL